MRGLRSVSRWAVAVGSGIIAVAAGLSPLPVHATGSEGFLFLQPGFTQTLWATNPNFLGGVAVATNGDMLTDACAFSGSPLTDYSQTSTTALNGSTLHNGTSLPSNAGCGLTNHPNGTIYTNTSGGVIQLNAATGAVMKGPFGPGGNALGIATDPLSPNNIVYVGSGGNLMFVDAALSTSGTFSTADSSDFKDQITWSPDGQFLFVSNRTAPFKLEIVNRSGGLVQNVNMAHEPDGIAFHAASPQFVVTNNTDGTMTRFDFPANNYTMAPALSDFATGGFRGDMSSVGKDGCLYVAQAGTRYANGTVGSTNSLVQICGGFAPPIGVGGTPPDGYLQFTLSSAMIDLYDQAGTKLTPTSTTPGPPFPTERGPVPTVISTYTFSVAGSQSTTITTRCSTDYLNCSITGIQYASGSTTTPVQNLLSVQYYKGNEGYTSLNQQVYIGNAIDTAEWNAGPNTTTLKHVKPSPATSQTLPGMVLLQIWTNKGAVQFQHT